MPTIIELEHRLTAIGQSLANSGRAYALLGLGSAGIERERMDDYSDLDFFVIAKEGYKTEFINDLSWLTSIQPKGYSVQNTVDGHKFLYADGIFCEFAVFEPHELPHIPFSPGQVVWSEPGFDLQCLTPTNNAGIYERNDNIEWIIGESLTNLYVGLGRYCRGEKLSAMKFVQSFSLDRLIDLIHLQQPNNDKWVDQYMPDRRLEARFNTIEDTLARCCQGYQHTPESALAQLDWLEKHYEINTAIAREIRNLAASAMCERNSS
jgi:hypothetical protein